MKPNSEEVLRSEQISPKGNLAYYNAAGERWCNMGHWYDPDKFNSQISWCRPHYNERLRENRKKHNGSQQIEVPAYHVELHALPAPVYARVLIPQSDLNDMAAQIFEQQNRACAICSRPAQRVEMLHVHIDTQDFFRGLLCVRCFRIIKALEELQMLERLDDFVEAVKAYLR